jgi:GTPase SAR1 family protein
MCFLGDQGVGKTSIIRVFVKGSFSADYKVRDAEVIGPDQTLHPLCPHDARWSH